MFNRILDAYHKAVAELNSFCDQLHQQALMRQTREDLIEKAEIAGLFGALDAAKYIDQIDENLETATPSTYLLAVFEQFPLLEKQFQEFIIGERVRMSTTVTANLN